MNTKKILVIVLTCILLVAGVCVGATYALWGKDISAEKDAGVDSDIWNENEKYLTFGVVYRQGSQDQIGWSVTGLKGSVPDKIEIPSEHKQGSQVYPVIEIASSFSNKTGIKEIILPKSIKSINNNAFTLFTDLTRVSVKSGATFTIGDTAFNACDMLLEFSYSGSSITKIGVDAFKGCIKLNNIPTVREG